MPQLSLTRISLLIILASLLALGLAWYTQYGLGFLPCHLCLKQRWPYYLAIGLGIVMQLLTRLDRPEAARWLVALVGVLMLAGAGIAIYHSGVEWKFWPGPTTCTKGGGFSGNVGDLMSQLKTARVVPCDEPPFRILGLSPAGYNVFYSLGFALFCFIYWRQGRS